MSVSSEAEARRMGKEQLEEVGLLVGLKSYIIKAIDSIALLVVIGGALCVY